MNLRPDLGSGPLDADVWIIGRDFGAEEAKAGQPFQPAPPPRVNAGTLLNQVLRETGWDRDEVRVDNVVPKQPRGNDWHAHDPADITWGQERLGQMLEVHTPKIVIALGNEASAFLLGPAWPLTVRGTPEGIQNVRGYLWDTRFGRVLTTLHPAGILRDWTPWRALLSVDFRKAKREVEAGCPPLDEREVTIVTTRRELEELYGAVRTHCENSGGGSKNVSRVASSYPREGPRRVSLRAPKRGSSSEASLHGRAVACGNGGLARWLSVDIENTHDLKLSCVGFAPDIRRAWVIPAEEPWQLDAIRELCASDVPKVLQNGQYDRLFGRLHGDFEIRAQAFDTQLAWHALNPELAGRKVQVGAKKPRYSRRTAKSLKFLASIYTRDRWWKDYAFSSAEERYRLCGVDCCTTLDIALKQAVQLEAA